MASLLADSGLHNTEGCRSVLEFGKKNSAFLTELTGGSEGKQPKIHVRMQSSVKQRWGRDERVAVTLCKVKQQQQQQPPPPPQKKKGGGGVNAVENSETVPQKTLAPNVSRVERAVCKCRFNDSCLIAVESQCSFSRSTGQKLHDGSMFFLPLCLLPVLLVSVQLKYDVHNTD